MPRHERYARTRIKSTPYLDLAGNIAVRPGAGELPTGELFPDRIVYNLDGSVTEAVPEDGLLSKVPICDICLRPVESVEEDLTERDNHWLCKDCLDVGPPIYPALGSKEPPLPISNVYGKSEEELYNIGDGDLWGLGEEENA